MTMPLFAIERIETWVIRVSIAVPVVCLAALALWHLAAYLAGKLAKERKAVRQSPEPDHFETDPQKLEQTCAGIVQSLAEMYLKLAESWLRKGQPQEAAAVLQKLIERCPETRQAQLARDRLQQLGAIEKHF